ncbi:MAG: glycosyltransferase family 2 protein [Methanoculleaceae archaeon]
MIAIIIPLYNEEQLVMLYPERLFQVVEKIMTKFGESCEYIMVDDGSSDSTLQRLNELQERYPSVTVLSHGKNRGLGAALRTGFEHCTADIVITMDADLTYQPKDIEILLNTFYETNADCVSASPYREKHLSSEITSPFRLYISKSVNLLYRLLLGNDITCASSIFRLYRFNALKELTLESSNFEINAEIISKLILSGKNVTEVGVKLYEREFGESKLNVRNEIRNNIRILFKIFKSRFLYKP